jgi:hypothetical protein
MSSCTAGPCRATVFRQDDLPVKAANCRGQLARLFPTFRLTNAQIGLKLFPR